MKTKLIIILYIFAGVFSNTQAKDSSSIYLLVPKGYQTNMQALNCFFKVFYPHDIPNDKMNVDYFIFNYSSTASTYTGIVRNTNSNSKPIKMNKKSLKDAKVRDLRDFFVASVSGNMSGWYGNYYLIDKEDYLNETIDEVTVNSAYTLKKYLPRNHRIDISSLAIPKNLYQIKITGNITEVYSYYPNNKQLNIIVDTCKNKLSYGEFNPEFGKTLPPKYDIELKKEKRNISITINDLYVKANEILGIKTIKGKDYIIPYKYIRPIDANNIHQEYYVKLEGCRVAKIDFNLSEKQHIRDLLEYKAIDKMIKLKP
ncbi:hypothetical protein [Plebeiibacterium sediminum]|uniref:Uncharacterized protein n=1 Tax=Plebeiibacterium sediminum TaxID=2992112 RepID=A0AAE3M475_9BACT|nr:hypothetical protein [Plebeiobacterium sediminum]MCW3786956.1 hypothetical protein [Plebeiobacterium sediminum]